MVYYTCFTKIFYNHARLIRLPIEIRGRDFISFGKNLTTGKYCRIEAFVSNENYAQKDIRLRLGDDIVMNDAVHIAAAHSVTIGNNVLIASKVFISDHNHGDYKNGGETSSPLIPPNDRPVVSAPVVIEDNVWIGEFVAVLPGVTIGKGSVIGSMSVVNRSIPPYSIAVGAPAVVIKTYDFDKQKWVSIK